MKRGYNTRNSRDCFENDGVVIVLLTEEPMHNPTQHLHETERHTIDDVFRWVVERLAESMFKILDGQRRRVCLRLVCERLVAVVRTCDQNLRLFRNPIKRTFPTNMLLVLAFRFLIRTRRCGTKKPRSCSGKRQSHSIKRRAALIICNNGTESLTNAPQAHRAVGSRACGNRGQLLTVTGSLQMNTKPICTFRHRHTRWRRIR
mmetsp:Transcript_10546/g.22334  ORF Transcript_10546/g.22334 Transcript_10546/m.22334 type:complete len:203 (-) Transcript_10546:145-753(-)